MQKAPPFSVQSVSQENQFLELQDKALQLEYFHRQVFLLLRAATRDLEVYLVANLHYPF
jgi:hypothetical protein